MRHGIACKYQLTVLRLLQIVYYDGQFDDSRLCTALACTAALAGATVLNHTSVTSLIKVWCLVPEHKLTAG